MEDVTALSALVLGLLLGMRHALDPDHIVAVSTIVSNYRNPLRSTWIGVSWGMGHTTTLFLIGLLVIALNVVIPDRLALFFEMVVGLILVFLGAQVLWKIHKSNLHRHEHEHHDEPHRHFHTHVETPSHQHHSSREWLLGWLRPSFRGKSYIIGLFHGLAGSAALTLLVLSTVHNPVIGLIYIALFGAGSMFGMGAITILLSLPFSISGSFPSFNRVIQMTAGVASVFFGVFLMYKILFLEHLLG